MTAHTLRLRPLQTIVLLLLLLAGMVSPAYGQETPPAPGAETPQAQPSATQIPEEELSPAVTFTPTLTLAPTQTQTLTSTQLPALDAAPPITVTIPATLSAQAAANLQLSMQVEALLARMTVADKVGQLFIITFQGNDTSFESDIAQLIYAYRVGGVAITPENGNFSNEPGSDTARQVATLTNKLQAISYGILLPDAVALQPVPMQPWPPGNFVSLERELGVQPPNLPLLIAIRQTGDNLPGSSLRRGFTPLPSQLAIGATWDLATSENIGAIVGRELRAVGVNLLLGPSLDVVEQPRADAVGSLGIFSFGGNPYWVGHLGRAYVAGVHSGSGGRVATAAGHFPGQGDLDRLPDEEVATIQRTASELQTAALPPFAAATRSQVVQSDPAAPADAGQTVTPATPITNTAAVTASAGALTATVAPALTTAPFPAQAPSGDPAVSDLLMTSHMSFSALQPASARSTPISLDPALNQLVQEQLGEWRNNGGLLLTGPLGVPAIRRYYDPTLSDYPARRVALDAFSAGHDLLYLADFGQNQSWESQLENYRTTIAFFQERYRSDPGFAAQVDTSVRRILRLKLRLFGSGFAPGSAPADAPAIPLAPLLVQEANLAVLPGSAAGSTTDPDPAPSQAARKALTLLYPDPAAATLPPAPKAGESIVIITDSRLLRECATCTAEAAVDPDAIARIILSLYGPEATGQIRPEDLTSLAFSDLIQTLPPETSLPAAAPTASSGTPPALVLPTATPTPFGSTTDLLDAPSEDGFQSQSGGDSDSNEETIANADWLIFAMLDMTDQSASSVALRRYLRQRSDQLADKHIVVLALNAPFFLDATEISKLSLYYGVYSKTGPFLSSAVRALFRSFTPEGSPSVAAPGTRFGSLAARLAPNPARTLPLRVTLADRELVSNAEPDAGGAVSAEPGTGLSVVNMGETIRVVVGPILDINGHTVPDGQEVIIEAGFEGADLALTIAPAQTRDGIAVRELNLDRSGLLRVAATAGEATSGEAVVLTVLEPQPTAGLAEPTVITVTVEPPPATPASATVPVTTTGEEDSALIVADRNGSPRRVNGLTLLLSLLVIVISLSLLLLVQIHMLPRETLLKSLLWAVIAGLAAYLLYSQGWFPAADIISDTLNIFGAPLVVFLAMLLPLFWLQLRGGRR